MRDFLNGLIPHWGPPTQHRNDEDTKDHKDTEKQSVARFPRPHEAGMSFKAATAALWPGNWEGAVKLPDLRGPGSYGYGMGASAALNRMYGSSPYDDAQTWQTRNEGLLAALDLSGPKQTKQSYDVPREEEVRRQEQEEIYRRVKENRRRELKESHRREKEEISRREYEQYRLREQERLNRLLREEEEEAFRRQEQREKGKGPARVQELRRASARERDLAFLNLRRQTTLEEFCELGRRARAAQPPYPRAVEEERQRDLAENGHLWSFDQADLLEFPHDFDLCKHCDHTEHVVVSSSRYRDVLARCQPRPPALYSWNQYGEREEWAVRFSLKHMRVMVFNSLGLRVKTSALAEHFANPAENDNGVGLALDFLDRDRKLFWGR